MKRGARRHTSFGWLVAIALLAPASAEEADDFQYLLELCKSVACHPPGNNVYVNLANGEVMTVSFEYPLPIVQDGLVAIYPGTTILIAGEIVDGRIVNLRVVDDAESPRNAIGVRMWQDSGKPDTFLAITNYFPALIKYRARMMPPDGDDIYDTSTCTVMGDGFLSLEHWPHPIFQLLLDEFVVVPNNGTITCS
jgi:hypothetical protein